MTQERNVNVFPTLEALSNEAVGLRVILLGSESIVLVTFHPAAGGYPPFLELQFADGSCKRLSAMDGCEVVSKKRG